MAQISPCVWRASRAPGEEELEGLPSAWGGGISWGLCSGPGPLQEGQLHQTHAWLNRGVWPSLSAGSTHMPWDLAVSAPPGMGLTQELSWPAEDSSEEGEGWGATPCQGRTRCV